MTIDRFQVCPSIAKELETGRATIRKASHFAQRKNWRFTLRVYPKVEGLRTFAEGIRRLAEGIRRGSGCKQSADRLDVTTGCGIVDRLHG